MTQIEPHAHDPPARWHRSLLLLAQMTLVAGVYFAGGKLGLRLAFANRNVTAVWPPTGIALAALLLFGWRVWPGIVAGALVTNLSNGASAMTSSAIAVGNTLAPLAAWLLLHRALRFRATLERVRDVLALVFVGGLASMAVSATAGTIALRATGAASASTTGSVWLVWWVGDAMGVVLFAPVLLTFASGHAREWLIRRRIGEASLLAAATLAAGFVFLSSSLPIEYLVFPLVAWAALRFELQGAATIGLGVAVLSILVTVAGHGSFAVGSPTTNLLTMQSFNLALMLSALLLASIAQDRRRTHDKLSQAADDLEIRVRERTSMLAAANDGLAEAQAITHIGSWRWDVRTDTVSWSAELYRIYGVDPDSFIPTYAGFLQLLHPADAAILNTKVRHSADTGEPFEVQHRVVRPDGEIRWVHGRGRLIREGEETVAMYGTSQDITESRRAEEALRHSEERFRALVKSAPEAMLVVDPSGVIRHHNDEAVELFGYSSEELEASPVDVLVPDHVKHAHQAHRAGYLYAPTRRTMAAGHDLWARRKDGTEVAVDISLSPIQTDDGILIVAAIRDVTERRRSEDQMREALERETAAAHRLRELDRTKDSLLVAVSHELRTPLTVIRGLASTLQRAELQRNPREFARLLDRLDSNAVRLERMLVNLLDLDRLSRGIIAPRRSPVNLNGLARRLIEALDLQGHPVEITGGDSIASVDPGQFERIIENLVANAVKYTPAGTPIWVQIDRADDGVLLRVEDAGRGVPKDLQNAIFEPFKRIEGDKAHAPGTGIGLSVVARFAELHGGRAWVEDRIGGGASFRVWLPDAPAPDGLEITSAEEQVQTDTG